MDEFERHADRNERRPGNSVNMRSSTVPVVLGLAVMAMTAPSHLSAQDTVASEGQESAAGSEIVVTGLREPFKLSAKQLRAMHEAYLRYRGRYAPNAAFALRLASATTPSDQPAPRLSLTGDDGLDIPYDASKRSFVFPAKLRVGKGVALTSNWRKGALSLTPFVNSPGTSMTDRTIGDLRLQCQTMWAGMRSEISFVARTAFSAAGGCNSSKISFYFSSERPLKSAVLQNGAAVSPVQIKADGMGYRAPIYDKTIPNAARIRLQYR